MTAPDVAALARLRDIFASGLQSLSSAELRAACLADLETLAAARKPEWVLCPKCRHVIVLADKSTRKANVRTP